MRFILQPPKRWMPGVGFKGKELIAVKKRYDLLYDTANCIILQNGKESRYLRTVQEGARETNKTTQAR